MNGLSLLFFLYMSMTKLEVLTWSRKGISVIAVFVIIVVVVYKTRYLSDKGEHAALHKINKYVSIQPEQ